MPEQSTTQRAVKVLLVEDDATLRTVLSSELGDLGYRIFEAESGTKALAMLRKTAVDVVLLDIKMPEMDGIEVLERVKRDQLSDAAIIILTGHGTIELAVQATQKGAFHFVTKPCSLGEIDGLIRKAYDHRILTRKNVALRGQVDQLVGSNEIVGESPAVISLLKKIQKVATSDAPVLVTGESGTGKELVARRIHTLSARADGPFVAVNCAALQDTLLESELFGYEKGAFTGAQDRKSGLFESAEGGTVLLDELGTMSLAVQAKLLRVLQFGTFNRLGGTTELTLDVRIIAATNQQLAKAIKDGRFREDLYYRLNTFEIAVPPLRDRPGDIAILAARILEQKTRGAKNLKLDEACIESLEGYAWPGNVRELANLMERTAILADDASEALDVISSYVASKRSEGIPGGEPGTLLADVEMAHIRRVLESCGGNKTEAARRLGIALKTLYNKLKGDTSST